MQGPGRCGILARQASAAACGPTALSARRDHRNSPESTSNLATLDFRFVQSLQDGFLLCLEASACCSECLQSASLQLPVLLVAGLNPEAAPVEQRANTSLGHPVP